MNAPGQVSIARYRQAVQAVEIVWRFFFLGSHNNISHLILLQFQHRAAQWSREAILPSVIALSLRVGHCDLAGNLDTHG